MKIDNRLYDSLKFIAQILLPTLGTLYVSLAALWDLPEPTKVSGTILAVDTALGVLLGLASNTYNKSGAGVDGSINVIDTPDKTNFVLAVDTPPELLAKQDKVVLKVTNVQNAATPTLGPDNATDPRLLG